MTSGLVLQDKYRLLSELGEGGMGRVWRARDLRLDAAVAVKLLHPREERNAASLARFEREAKAAASLRSPHVVQILDYGVDAATSAPFIVMELLEGQSLKARLEQAGYLPFDEVCRVVTHVARALTRAHAAHVIHRDLKPANIFLVHNDDVEIAKVLDFGIAKWAHSPLRGGSTETDVFMGTPAYMSPEQILSAKNVDQRADLWSLAIIAVECLTGSVPFSSDNLPGLALAITQGRYTLPSQIGRVPVGFDAWFERAAALDPRDRFASAALLAQELVALRDAPLVGSTTAGRHAQAAASASTSPLSSAAPGPRRTRRRRHWSLAAGTLGLLVAGWLGMRQDGNLPDVAKAELRGGPSGATPMALRTSASAAPPAAAPAPAAPPGLEGSVPPPASPTVAPLREPPGAAPAPAPAVTSEGPERPVAAASASAGRARPGQRRVDATASDEPPPERPTRPLSSKLQPWPEEPTAVISVAALASAEAATDGVASLQPEAAHELLAINPAVPPFRATLPSPYLAPGKRYTAVARVCVDAEGAVTSVRIVRPSIPRLDFQLRNVLPRWRYRPYLLDGIPTPFCYPLNYTIAAAR